MSLPDSVEGHIVTLLAKVLGDGILEGRSKAMGNITGLVECDVELAEKTTIVPDSGLWTLGQGFRVGCHGDVRCWLTDDGKCWRRESRLASDART